MFQFVNWKGNNLISQSAEDYLLFHKFGNVRVKHTLYNFCMVILKFINDINSLRFRFYYYCCCCFCFFCAFCLHRVYWKLHERTRFRRCLFNDLFITFSLFFLHVFVHLSIHNSLELFKILWNRSCFSLLFLTPVTLYVLFSCSVESPWYAKRCWRGMYSFDCFLFKLVLAFALNVSNERDEKF